MGIKNKKIEIVTGSVSNRGNVDSIDNLRAYATPNLEVYRSMFLYDDTFTGDIKKYDGTFEINEIILDVDIKDGDLNNIKDLYAFLADEFTNEYFRNRKPNYFGWVVFARNKPQHWVKALFQMP